MLQTKDTGSLNGYKNKTRTMLSTRDPLRSRDTYRLKVRRGKKIFHANGNKKKAGVAILISDKIDFKIKTITRDKEGHYIIIKGSIQEEYITIVNLCTQHRSTSIHKANANSHKRGNQQ